MKPITFLGNSLGEVRSFPTGARRELGYQLDRVQRGRMPEDWKPMKTIGRSVCEIRVRDDGGAFRVIYLATLPESVYVLHAFQKKTQATSKADLELVRSRLKELMRSRT